MSLVVFPFKKEDPQVVSENVRMAARHHLVSEVLCVASSQDEAFRAVENLVGQLAGDAAPIRLVVQERIGVLRPGKGDAMNTALDWFLTHSQSNHLHFYDADITNFGPHWIDAAEQTAAQGFPVVRHYFPRASTDAMVTWLITRPGLAMCWPDSVLPDIGQPLGGELLLSRAAVQTLAANRHVQAQSDWGIDTRYTIETAAAGMGIAETYIDQGKIHRLYGPLTDIKTMVFECFSALQAARPITVPTGTLHYQQPSGPAPPQVTSKMAYSVGDTVQLLRQGWTARQEELLGLFDPEVVTGMLAGRDYPLLGFFGAELWGRAYRVLLDHFVLADSDWRELLFRLWVARVLSYTVTQAVRGYDAALNYLEGTISTYRSPARASPAAQPT